MDTRFIGQPHHWDPRRLYSQTGADWQIVWTLTGCARSASQKLRAPMKAQRPWRAGAVAGANIRYATASYQGNWKYNINIRYAVVTHRDPVLFETAGSDLHCAEIDLPWMEGQHSSGDYLAVGRGRRAVHGRTHGRKCHGCAQGKGVAKEQIGIDNFDMPALEAFQKTGINIVNGWPAVSQARVIKTGTKSNC